MSRTAQGALAVSGGVIVHLALGAVYTFGNMSPYFSSYIFNIDPANSDYDDIKAGVGFTFALGFVGQALSMPLGGFLEPKWGPRWTCALGCGVMVVAVLASHETVDTVVGLVAVYGCLVGLGVGIAYAAPVAMAMKWMPNNRGLATGLVLAGFGGGSSIFNQVQTWQINPDNADPCLDEYGDPAQYPTSVTDNLQPTLFILAACYAVLMLIGLALMRDPPLDEHGNELLQDETAGDDSEQQQKLAPLVASSGAGSECSLKEEDEEEEATLRQLLTSDLFWLLFASYALLGVCAVVITSQWKVLGEEKEVGDDKFRTMVGSVSAVFNAVGRICVGLLLDKLGYPRTVSLLSLVWAALLATTSYLGTLNEGAYFFWICANLFCLGGNYSLFAPTVAEIFGKTNVARNYGLIFLSQIPASLISSFAFQGLVDAIPKENRWEILTLCFAALPILTIGLTMVYVQRLAARKRRIEAGHGAYGQYDLDASSGYTPPVSIAGGIRYS